MVVSIFFSIIFRVLRKNQSLGESHVEAGMVPEDLAKSCLHASDALSIIKPSSHWPLRVYVHA